MSQAVRCPWDGVEPFRLDRAAVDEAFAVRAVLDAAESILHLLQNHRVELGLAEFGTDRDVGLAGVAGVERLVRQFFATVFHVALDACLELLFEFKKAFFIALSVHDGDQYAPGSDNIRVTMKKILLQTTIPYTADDWNITRFSMLRAHLRDGGFDVTSRDKEDLTRIDQSDFDQMWLIAVDTGSGLSAKECEAIARFNKGGRGLLVARDHQDLGSSVCTIDGIGTAHHFHSRNLDPDTAHRTRDDQQARDIDWPNFHSGQNGEYQRIRAAGDRHPLLAREDGSTIEWFPAHPHEGDVSAPPSDHSARVIATGTSKTTGHAFNLIVALEGNGKRGPGVAESSFHHFCDYNWDPRAGAPSFVTDPAGDEVVRDPKRLGDIKRYVRNAARWLAAK